MSIRETIVGFASKYGPHAKLVASGVLNVVAPGSAALINITEHALDAAKDIADNLDHKQWEEQLLDRVNQSHVEIERLGKLLDCLLGPLAAVCDKAAVFANDPEQLGEVVSRAIASDPTLSVALHEIQELKSKFVVFHRDIRRIAKHQEEVLPVYDRMNRVADYFDELWESGIKPRDFVRQVTSHREVVSKIRQGDTADVDEAIEELQSATPNAASVRVLKAAAATREFDYPAAQRALNQAVRLRPHDRELANVAQKVTVMATRTSKRRGPEKPTGKSRIQPGESLDGWQLQERRGAGGWGQVFKATKGRETKAVKIMHPELAADPVFLERFKKEIASLWALPKHPNLLAIDKPERSFGFCMNHQTWYLAMEYIDGPTLESYLATKGKINELLVHKVFNHLIEGLALAHQANIVHRDIKPGNMIFRKSDQRLVLVDFGLAVGVEDFGETKVGGVSIQFAAPEQHYGGAATKASDVFSLCAVMHYSLNYDTPDLRTPHSFNPLLAPESLRDVLSRGIVMTPEKRFKDAGELLEVLNKTKPSIRSVEKQVNAPTALPELPVAKAADRSVNEAATEDAKEGSPAGLPQQQDSTASAQDLKKKKRKAKQEQQRRREEKRLVEERRKDLEPPSKPLRQDSVTVENPVDHRDAKPPVNPAAKPPVKPDAKTSVNPAAKPPVNPDAKPPVKPETKTSVKVEAKPPVKPEASTGHAPANATLPLDQLESTVGKPPSLNRLFAIGGIPLALLLIWQGWYLLQTSMINWWLNFYVARLDMGLGIGLIALSVAVFCQAGGSARWIKTWTRLALLLSIIFMLIWGTAIFESVSRGGRDEASASRTARNIDNIGDSAARSSRPAFTEMDHYPSAGSVYQHAPTAFGLMLLTFLFAVTLQFKQRSQPVQNMFREWDAVKETGKSPEIWPLLIGVVGLAFGLINGISALLLTMLLSGWWLLICFFWAAMGLWLVISAIGILLHRPSGIVSIKLWAIVSIISGIGIDVGVAWQQESSFFWSDGIMTLPLNLAWALTFPIIVLLWLTRPGVVQTVDTWRKDSKPMLSSRAAFTLGLAGAAVAAILMITLFSNAIARVNAVTTRIHMEKIRDSIFNYEDTFLSFPGAATPLQPSGPEVSWRVKILPQLGYGELYDRYDFSKPWDSPENKALIPLMPEEFVSLGIKSQTDGQAGYTRFQVVVDPHSIFPPNAEDSFLKIKRSLISDGSANTVLFVESKFPKIWTDPQGNISGTRFNAGSLEIRSGNSVFMAMADGNVKIIKSDISEKSFQKLMNRHDRENVNLDDITLD